ncbi:MAG: hypothetical protein ACFE88_16225 [Candidatus Hermodarchaeota archaeon]
MKTKNISINIKKGEKIPYKETYITFYKHKNKIKIDQKFIEQTKNQSITLNLEESERLINLLTFFVFNGKFKPYKGKMLKFKKC